MQRDRHNGKVALVTGAGSGIGRASALRLMLEGAHVVGCSPSQEGLDGTRREILDAMAGAEPVLIPADLTVEADLEGVVAATVERFGRIDLVANVAGISD